MPTVLQSGNTNSTNASNVSVNLSGQASGNRIIVCGEDTGAGTFIIGDSQSNTYTLDATNTNWGIQLSALKIWSAIAQSGNNTITLSGIANFGKYLTVYEVAGLTGTIIAIGSGQFKANSGQTQSITPASSGFVIALYVSEAPTGSATYASGWISGIGAIIANEGFGTTNCQYAINWPGDATVCPFQFGTSSTPRQEAISVAYSASGQPSTFWLESGPKHQYRREGVRLR